MRLTALACFGGAALINVGCLGAYAAMTFNFGIWLSELNLSHPGVTFSTCSVACVMLTFVVLLLPALVKFCGGIPPKHGDEDEFYDQHPYPVDQYGNPLPCDEYGNPIAVDQYGNPMPVGPPPGAYDPNTGNQDAYPQPGAYDAYGAQP